MLLGLGNDIVEIDRIKRLFQRYPEKFLKTLFTPFEQEYCLAKKEPSVHFSGRFAAKEAIVKALGTGFSQNVTWLDIEIKNDALGKPLVVLSSFLEQKFNYPVIHLSISHCKAYATAVAIWVS